MKDNNPEFMEKVTKNIKIAQITFMRISNCCRDYGVSIGCLDSVDQVINLIF